MRGSVLLFGLAAFCLAGPTLANAKFGGFSAPRSFSMGHVNQPPTSHPMHPHGFALGGATALNTLQVGTFVTGPDYSPDASAAPYGYPPPVYYPAYYAPPRPCFQPLLIHLTPETPAGKLPRVVYGTRPAACHE
jgi:hypothetical protein